MYDYLNKKCKELLSKLDNRKIVIYPYGKFGMEVHRILQTRYGIEDILLVDNDVCRFNKNVISFDALLQIREKGNENAIICICSNNSDIYVEIRLKVYNYFSNIDIFDFFDSHPLQWDQNRRIVSLTYASQLIYQRNVKGEIAEAGVYKGGFARYLNVMFPDRKLFLFDTFEGFDKNDVVSNKDNTSQTEKWINGHKDTNVELVLNNMQYRNNVIIRKGLFPESANGINEMFAFVNLDMDLFLPTYEGLKFFWQRLSPGGIIFVHDYGTWDGINKAVEQFSSEENVGFMCMFDRVTVAFAKAKK